MSIFTNCFQRDGWAWGRLGQRECLEIQSTCSQQVSIREYGQRDSHSDYSAHLHIGVAPITQLRTCVIKIVTFKGGHLMW